MIRKAPPVSLSGVNPHRLRLAGRYERVVGASLARVWENVFDWEHLSTLHADDFQAVTMLENAEWGWRVRLVNQPGDAAKVQTIEMRADKPGGRYCAATLDGPGAGTEIRTRLEFQSPRRTTVVVEFHVPEERSDRLDRIGQRYAEIYRRLWDQDEAMMVGRERALAARRRAPLPRARKLGRLEAVREAAPMVVTFGGARFRIVELDGGFAAHAVTCPHWLGPLDGAREENGIIRCPWHGYSFDIRTGRSCDGHDLRLEPAPKVSVENGWVVLGRDAIGA
jgi:nitrite reductase/ring-hydroxylating ferredoxin subunit